MPRLHRAVTEPGPGAAIPVDGKGKTGTPSKRELIRGMRLSNVACGTCHDSGGAHANQCVGLGMLVDYINAPTTHDGMKDISDVHAPIIASDLWPEMRSSKQQDLRDTSVYTLYSDCVIHGIWLALTDRLQSASPKTEDQAKVTTRRQPAARPSGPRHMSCVCALAKIGAVKFHRRSRTWLRF
ncbi:unnamed protein product [Prorocentrum cordatum]|uniref:Cytochrome c-550 domain-containing protein n=1 Tax=Prorocentrum cordatum TaxID=2364126 RepID=A0ABN9U895_9DINO|nr:unnamed protein product [Polarella glacialis]